MPYQMPPWRGETTLRDKIVNTLREFAESVVNFVSSPIRDGLHNLTEWFTRTMRDEFVQHFGPQLVAMRDDPDTPPALRSYINSVLSPQTPFHPVVLAALVGAVVGIASMLINGLVLGPAMLGPIRKIQMWWMERFRPARPSARDVGEAYWRGYTDLETFRANLTDMGFPDDIQEYLRMNSRQVPFLSVLQQLYYRGQLTEAGVKNELRQLGHDQATVDKLFAIFPNLPSVADLITMLAREAFEPDMIAHYGLGDEYPELFTEEMKKLGYDREVSLRHWYKHWDVPSLTQVYAMLHRGVLQPKDVWDFFRLVEISPFWRDKLIQIQYRLPTRVDIRRMYRDGHLTRDEVYELYKKLGYSPENAELLTELAVTFYKSADKSLTRSDIVTAYTKLGWAREEAAEMLGELGYDPAETDYYLDYADYQRVKEYVDTAEKLIKTQYVRGIIDQATASARLGELGENAAQIATLVALWTLEREAKVEHPTVSQLSDFYERRIIAGPRLDEQLSHLNYTPEYISWIHTAIDSRIAEENAKKSASELRAEMARHRYPTLSDLDSWIAAGIINEVVYRQRIIDLGYSPEEAEHYVEEQRRKLAGQPAFPTRADLGRWFRSNIIPREQYIARMAELGYSRADVDLYLAEFYAKMTEEQQRAEEAAAREELARIRVPTKADLDRWALVGIITMEEYHDHMSALGYARVDIDRYQAELYLKMRAE